VLCVGWPFSSSSLKWSSGSLSSMGLCCVSGPVPDLVNALNLSLDPFMGAEDVKGVYEG